LISLRVVVIYRQNEWDRQAILSEPRDARTGGTQTLNIYFHEMVQFLSEATSRACAEGETAF
jgi:hypothetical protein